MLKFNAWIFFILTKEFTSSLNLEKIKSKKRYVTQDFIIGFASSLKYRISDYAKPDPIGWNVLPSRFSQTCPVHHTNTRCTLTET